ncbi:GNAT family N-acetyltransferase [Pelagibius marinus]|uniref:GNAT family N-acetyltransferase n=1 Tax=Pelagibius marinus TaxID=2762760 RepID=UPI001872E39F|nr:GNAT family N-acetyltransferase [Pelagibius marinus]
MAEVVVAPAAGADLDDVRDLFREYAAWLRVDYCLQDFEAELAGLPGAYAPPAGGLWIARVDGAPAGVVGLWPLADGACEMKRLWLREAYRGLGLGHRLAEAALAGARAGGHRRMVLETLDFMTAAQALYAELGFRAVPPEPGTPANVRRLVCDLSALASA